VADRLRDAAAEGRLLTRELEHRLGAAFAARTYGELDALVADLPSGRLERRRGAHLAPWVRPAMALAIAIPVALAAVVAVMFVVAGLLATWMVWAAIGWFFFAHRRHGRRRYPGPRVHARPRRSWI
jgi:uncharacterized protein DUF1707